ncbi:hypothetical protein [Micromonospora sp. NPDC049171]|uniref:hypothetical protein n=1 Tax=Micromonospora sp. NPDC049171 TaxID=3155770 RepID=UPI0033C3ADF4
MSVGKAAGAKMLQALAVCVVFAPCVVVWGGLVYWYDESTDPTPGLTYQSGDRPREHNRPICVQQGVAQCPPRQMMWTVPGGGSVTTRFALDDAEDTRVTGSFEVRGGCSPVVDWTITAQGRTIAGARTRVRLVDEQFLGEARLLPGDQAVTLAARRTDRGSCEAVLVWNAAGTTTD